MTLEITTRTSLPEPSKKMLCRLPFAWEQDGNVYEQALREGQITYWLPNEQHRRFWGHCPPVWMTNPLTRDHWRFIQGAAHRQLGLLQ